MAAPVPDTLGLAERHAGDDVGRIVAVLEAAGSAYLPALLELREAVRLSGSSKGWIDFLIRVRVILCGHSNWRISCT